MLVLSRTINQSIMIGDIEVIIVDVKGDKVRLGITAPKHIPVHRREIYDKILKAKRMEHKRKEAEATPTEEQPKSEQ